MFVISRKQDEKIKLKIYSRGTAADPIVVNISVAEIKRNKIKLNFDAPKSVVILRAEQDRKEMASGLERPAT